MPVKAGIHFEFLLAAAFQSQELLSVCGSRVTFSLRGHASKAGPKGGVQNALEQRKVTKEEGRPAWHLPGIVLDFTPAQRKVSGRAACHPDTLIRKRCAVAWVDRRLVLTMAT